MAEKKLFKDWFDEGAAAHLAGQMTHVFPEFDRKQFLRLAIRDLENLEFSQRIRQFSEALAAVLPANPVEALEILVESLPEILPGEESVTDGYLQWPLGQFIADYGVDHFEESFEAMLALTQRFSAEFAVRPFAQKYPEETLRRLLEFTSHPNSHVRRWCSEGVRPRLPWGGHLKSLMQDPSPLWPILEALRDDPSLYVRRSVANNLNDIAKDHPDLVVARCREWMRDAGSDRQWIVKHGLRSLVKAGHPGALEVMGFYPPRQIDAEFDCSSSVRIGDSLRMSARLTNRSSKAQDLVVDFLLHYRRAKGKMSGKVFKWKNLLLEPGETTLLDKLHSMKKTTIRKLYPGLHKVELQVNGRQMARADFELLR